MIEVAQGMHPVIHARVSQSVPSKQLAGAFQGGEGAEVDGNGNFVCKQFDMGLQGCGMRPVIDIHPLVGPLPHDEREDVRADLQRTQVFLAEQFTKQFEIHSHRVRINRVLRFFSITPTTHRPPPRCDETGILSLVIAGFSGAGLEKSD